ncbi:MAG: hypothetical protein HYY40_07895 [Bacteroidetes bacterium]|nr:hypothetical protein [Bacteroidota bacterium]
MSFSFHNNSILPRDSALVQSIESASAVLYDRMRSLDYLDLPISDYSKKYMGEHIRKLTYSLRVYGFILSWSILKTGKKPGDLCLADNGGGTGILSLLAKAAGVKTVVYNDYYDISCRDASVIGTALGFPADSYVHGEIDALGNFFTGRGIHCDIIASRNLIEHIYDLEGYFRTCYVLFSAPLVIFHATTANVKNPLINLYTKKLHRIAEYKGKKTDWGFKQMDSSTPFSELRRQIIGEHARGVPETEIKKLVRATRGLSADDIVKAMEEYRNGGTIPSPPVHPTNTCDPATGNWEEQLVSPRQYRDLAEKNGFDLEIINGFYNTNYDNKLLNPIASVVNYVIRKSPQSMGAYAAPFIGLCFTK